MKYGPFTRLSTTKGIDMQYVRSFTIEIWLKPLAIPLVGNLFAIEYDITLATGTNID